MTRRTLFCVARQVVDELRKVIRRGIVDLAQAHGTALDGAARGTRRAGLAIIAPAL